MIQTERTIRAKLSNGINITADVENSWIRFIENTDNFGHAQRHILGASLREHIELCLDGARQSVNRIKGDLECFKPSTILEIGSSAGILCLALQERFPEARVIGIEPETQALLAARSLRFPPNERNEPNFIAGIGEALSFPDSSIDLIVCHTVIEHVQNVSDVLREMKRVLSPNGIIHLEAPNYLWPYEPHLQIWTVPMFGKGFVRLCARLARKKSQVDFINHLQFVTPFKLEKEFEKNGLSWTNRVRQKVNDAASGLNAVSYYKGVSRIIHGFGKVGLGKFLAALILRSGLYSSVLYTIRHAESRRQL